MQLSRFSERAFVVKRRRQNLYASCSLIIGRGVARVDRGKHGQRDAAGLMTSCDVITDRRDVRCRRVLPVVYHVRRR